MNANEDKDARQLVERESPYPHPACVTEACVQSNSHFTTLNSSSPSGREGPFRRFITSPSAVLAGRAFERSETAARYSLSPGQRVRVRGIELRSTQRLGAFLKFTGLVVALVCAPVARAGGGLNAGHAVVATVHPLATDAAVEAFRNGGNAIDAAVAAGLTLGIVG